MFRVKKVCPSAVIPTKGSKYSAGYDISAAYDTVVPAGEKALVRTGLIFELPEDIYARIAPRSGLAVRHFIDVGAGVVDPDYRGEINVLLFNFSKEDFHIKAGDRIAQAILEKFYSPEIEEVTEVTTTERADGGFGSTGVAKI